MRSQRLSAPVLAGLFSSFVVPCLLASVPSAQVGTATSIGPLGGSANAALVDPTDDATIFTATLEDGLLRSTDGGASFAPFGSGLDGAGTITSLQADPGAPTTLYLLAGAQIYRSTDSGASWSPLSLMADAGLCALTIQGSLLLANDSSGLWRSPDAGATWSKVHTGTLFEDVELAASDPDIAYLGHIGGVDKSVDGGLTWNPTPGFSNWARALAVDPTDADVVYAAGASGAFDKSTDGGQTSSSITNGWSSSSARFLEFEPGSTTALYGGALDGIYRTSNGGRRWRAANDGLSTTPPIPSQLTFAGGGDVYLATEGGFFRLAGAMLPWEQLGFASVDVLDVAFGSAGGQRLASTIKGVYRGAAGEQLTPSQFLFDFGGHTEVLWIDPDDPGRWIAGGVGSFLDNAQVRVLENDGQDVEITYEQFGAGRVRTLVSSPDDPDLMLGGVAPNSFGAAGILRSTDRAQSWTGVAGTTNWPVVSIDVDPHDPQHAVAYFLDHRWAESTNGGQSWTERDDVPWSGSGGAVRFAFDPFDANLWYRITTGEGLLRSDDAGASWTPVGTTANEESDLLLHPALEGHLWTTDGAGQVLYSTDRGATLELVFGLDSADAGALAFDASTNELLVGSLGASAWEIDDATPFVALGGAATTSTGDAPSHSTQGGLPRVGNAAFALSGSYEPAGAQGVLAISTTDPDVPFRGGTLHVTAPFVELLAVPGGDDFVLTVGVPDDLALIGQTFTTQYGVLDGGVALSDALATTILP